MNALRALWSDLVEKRLWPVAALLVAALVAVPLVLAKSAPSDGGGTAPALPAAAAAVGAGAAAPGEPVVSVTSVSVGGAPLRGVAKNPFRQQHVPPAVPASGGAAAPGTSTTPSGSSGGTTPSGGGTAPPGNATPTPKPTPVYLSASIDVRFGKAGGSLRTISDVPRLTPLPSAASPVVIFLGMRQDLKTAVFMVSSDVHAQGDGTCIPSAKDCEAIELKADQVAFLDVAADDGKVTQYELDLVNVTVKQTTSKAKAQASYARASRAGAALLRHSAASAAVASALRYSATTGVLAAVPGSYLSHIGGAVAPQAR